MRGEEREAFDDFVRTRYRELLRFGQALAGSADGGADLVQDALERTLMAWPRLERRRDPEAYVRRTMVNRNISIWRRARREWLTDEPPEQPHLDAVVDGWVWTVLQSLPPRQRAVVALRYYEDLSEADIARVLGCSVGTVKSQAARALDKMRAVMPADAVREA